MRGEPGVVETRVEGAISPVEPKAGRASGPRRRSAAGPSTATAGRRSCAAARRPPRSPSPSRRPESRPIKLTEEPRANVSGSLTLAYHLDDRYGRRRRARRFRASARSVEAGPAKPGAAAAGRPRNRRRRRTASATPARPPISPSTPGPARRSSMTLSAQSVSGKSGASAPVEVTLPQRPFHNPLARALVEERRDLILDPDHAPKRVEAALTGLSVAPELFDTPANVYLGLKQARTLARRMRIATPTSSMSPRSCGRWRSRSRTATPPRPSATCAPPSRRCARRSSAARATRRSGS